VSTRRLLIVDDEPAVARVIQRVAEGCGYEVILTTSADAFLDRLAEQEPTVVIVDLSLPGTDGVELLRHLAGSKCRADILIVSGFDERVLETAGRLGSALGLRIAGTVTKPVRVAELRGVLDGLRQAPLV